jgi:N-formylglutamate amidohydrolase
MAKHNVVISIELHSKHSSITVGDIREWIARVNQFNIPDKTEVHCTELFVDYAIKNSMIEEVICGEHIGFPEFKDVIITTHDCASRTED